MKSIGGRKIYIYSLMPLLINDASVTILFKNNKNVKFSCIYTRVILMINHHHYDIALDIYCYDLSLV